jgi:hypothetical protein
MLKALSPQGLRSSWREPGERLNRLGEGEFERVSELYRAIGSVPDEETARRRARNDYADVSGSLVPKRGKSSTSSSTSAL